MSRGALLALLALLVLFSFAEAAKRQPAVIASFSPQNGLARVGDRVDLMLHLLALDAAPQVEVWFILPPSPQATMTAGTVSPSMVEQPPQTFAPPGPITSPGGTAVAGKGAITSPAPSIGAAGSAGSTAQPPDDNPFARALRERAQEASPSTAFDNPFQSGSQASSSPQPPGDNPFLRALRERGSSPTSTQDNTVPEGASRKGVLGVHELVMAGPACRGSITEAAVLPGAFPRERGGDADHRA